MERKSQGIPLVSSDFCFVGQEGEDNVIILVTRDHISRYVFAHCATSKSCTADPWLVEQTCKDLDTLGYGVLEYRVDNEPAMRELQEKVRDSRMIEKEAQVIISNSPPKSSASAGPVEKAVQEVEGMVRTIKIALEDRVGSRVSVKSLIFQWIVEHSADMLNRFCIGHDGRTPLTRLKGRQSFRPIAEIGECVLYKVHPERGRLFKLEPRWREGVWLGLDRRTGESIVGTCVGTVRARSIRRRPFAERWSMTALSSFKGSPRNPTAAPDNDEANRPASANEPKVHRPQAEPEVTVPRQMYITKKDLEKYGYSIGCEGCLTAERNAKRKPHTDACRRRIRAAMQEGDEDQIRVEQEDARCTST